MAHPGVKIPRENGLSIGDIPFHFALNGTRAELSSSRA